MLEHPVSEGLAGQRVDKVDDPLARQLPQVILIWEVGCNLGVLACLAQELLDAEALVLGHRQVQHLVTVEELALAVDELLQEVDRVAVQRGEVGVALNGEEVVPVRKVSFSASTYTSRLERNFEANIAAVTCYYCDSANIVSIRIFPTIISD